MHAEACVHLHRSIQLIRSHGAMTGVVINPATPVSAIEPILADVDLVLLMKILVLVPTIYPSHLNKGTETVELRKSMNFLSS